ncbi:hypothetical protein [Urbifossiella limnaea]|uniref:Uncharacterized protein n=1 Tax=Urbifossiella limnaea TaxID=2528023 RepID=A0A517XPT9_9BACT|nr:hypothetical protein [Urbifossiella limnaea]QDU19513.1 hypothetical protein ETAA1_14420 [Urbifossiella limnaea]
MNRKREQAVMLDRLGQFFGPVLKVAATPQGYDAEEKQRIAARFYAEHRTFSGEIERFCKGEPHHHYLAELNKVLTTLFGLVNRSYGEKGGDLFDHAPAAHGIMMEALCSIPTPIDSTIHDAVTPFSTYCLVRDLCATANGQVMWMDRYFDQTLFARYLVEVPKSAVVTLITYPESKCQGKKQEQRYADFMAVSKLYAAERGPTGYRLMTDGGFHDRLLRCNDKLFSLGGSIKDLGNDSTFTLAKLDSTSDNFKKFDDAIAAAVEVFGPNQPVHPV